MEPSAPGRISDSFTARGYTESPTPFPPRRLDPNETIGIAVKRLLERLDAAMDGSAVARSHNLYAVDDTVFKRKICFG